MTVIRCDRCGTVEGGIATLCFNGNLHGQTYDLCGKCISQFKNIFMKNHPLLLQEDK